MSGKSRAIAVAAAAAGLICLWAPTALASTTQAPLGTHGWLVNGGVVNGGLVNVNLGSGNTAIGNTCYNTDKPGPLGESVLAWALDVSHNTCVMAGGPTHT